MYSDIAVKAEHLSKIYPVFNRPVDRLKQYFWRNKRQFYKAFTALEDISFELKQGDILGIVGRNGSGKSTLLQIVCSTLTATSGDILVNGRIAALLELGAGFNPEFSGRENIYLNASILGLSQEEISSRYEDIVDFSGVREFIDQPVKTYSSGMYVRLAFSVAVSVDPDILIIDEALSVGDGAFSRKSFERIMELKEMGKTILFCSHSMYQIEALCNKALWIEKGRIKKQGDPASVVVAYNSFLENFNEGAKSKQSPEEDFKRLSVSQTNKFKKIEVIANGQADKQHVLTSKQSDLTVYVEFLSDVNIPAPHVGIAIFSDDGRVVASATTHNDGKQLTRNEQGMGSVEIFFPRLPLLKGLYYIDLYLVCENAIHVYEHAMRVAEIKMLQQGIEQGIFAIEHQWK